MHGFHGDKCESSTQCARGHACSRAGFCVDTVNAGNPGELCAKDSHCRKGLYCDKATQRQRGIDDLTVHGICNGEKADGSWYYSMDEVEEMFPGKSLWDRIGGGRLEKEDALTLDQPETEFRRLRATVVATGHRCQSNFECQKKFGSSTFCQGDWDPQCVKVEKSSWPDRRLEGDSLAGQAPTPAL